MAAKKSTSREVANWDEELSKQAQIAAAREESTATGQFFSLKSGVLSLNDSPQPNNEMAVIILDGIFETVFYQGKYDPDSPQGPTAFALGREEKDLVWHENSSPEFAGKPCAESEVCQWGSADVGRGKAARETRRLAMIFAGTFENGKFKPITDAEQIADSQIAYMRLPVMSVKGYSGFVKQVAASLKRPLHAIFTKVKVVPDPSSQFKVTFEALANVPNNLIPVVLERHEEAKSLIEFPYPQFEEQEEAPAKRSSKAASAKSKSKPVAARGKRY